MDRVNYAAAECGARIVGTNAGARGAHALLQPQNRDGYLANVCAAPRPHWAAVELCADVRVDALVLASHEPFASPPRDVRLWGRRLGGEWLLLGAWVLENTRRAQTLDVAPRDAYVRQVRVELLSAYGREHYCVLSEVRVHGKTMLDDYEEEDRGADGRALATLAGAPDGPANVFRRIHERVARLERTHAAAMGALQRAFRQTSPEAPRIDAAPRDLIGCPGGYSALWAAVAMQTLFILALFVAFLRRGSSDRSSAPPTASALPSPVDASAPLLDDGGAPAVIDASYVSVPSSPRDKAE